MKKAAILVFALACLALAAPRRPKLIVTIIIDQFRFDYLTRYRTEYTAGFDRLLTRGAVFASANYIHVPAITAVGHSTILSGATPSISGIVANDWYDREERAAVTSVSDKATDLLGGAAGRKGSSPNRMLVSTIGDQLKMVSANSHVIGISLKDRSAILPAGHMADGAIWFDDKTGNFVSSTYYYPELPAWVREYNAARPVDRYKGVTWLGHQLPVDAKLYNAMETTPFGNDLVEAMAERALSAVDLGKHDATDLLVVSFSSNDYVGHDYGPDSKEAHEISTATDRLLGKFLQAVDAQAGADNVLVVLTADHGGAPLPETNRARKMPGGRLLSSSIKQTVQSALVARYGPGEWVAGAWDLAVYLNRDLIAGKKLDLTEVQHEAAGALEALPHVFRVYTLDDAAHGRVLPDEITRKVVNGFNLRRSPDVEFIPDPYWVVRTSDSGTSHASPFSYDTHVPIIFMGSGIRPGTYYQPVIVNDIAPTLAAILQIEPPSGSVGRVLSEIFE
ncbi:MAG TPA: alkaline phosphatase family protein [Candidatus Acidoferrales bacterium]|nr:alkaline phosphatase family protein [Candidatus Acidoferrales bacterium]